MIKRKLSEWEKEKGFVAISLDPNKVMSEEEVNEVSRGDVRGVNHKDRVEFLTANGYKITRENLIDTSLESVPKAE